MQVTESKRLTVLLKSRKREREREQEGHAEMASRAERVCEGNYHLITSHLMDCADSKVEKNRVRERREEEGGTE